MPSLLITGDPVLTKAIILFVGHCSTIFAGSFSKLGGNFVGVHTPVVPVSDGRILLDLLLLLPLMLERGPFNTKACHIHVKATIIKLSVPNLS